MDTKNFLNKVCEQIKYKPARTAISKEMEQHINDIKEEYTSKGIAENEAEEKAVLQMGNAEEIGRKLNKIHKPKFDWRLVLLIAILTGFGILVTFVKTHSIEENVNVGNIGNTLVYAVIGVILSIGIYFFDYKKIRKYSLLIYLISTTLMVLPLFGIGGTINGMYYIRFLGISFFSATITVPLYLISFIGFIMDYRKDNVKKIQLYSHEISFNKDLIKIIVLSCISLLLIMCMPSVANMIILGSSYIIISTIKIIKDKNHSARKLAILYGTILALILFFVMVEMMNLSFRLDRVIYSFNPNDDPTGKGYIGMLQKEVLNNAQIVGQAENMSFPIDESILKLETNYSFIYLIGKCGLLVAGLLVITIILTSVRLILNAKNVKEQYGKYLIIGLGSLFILQSFATVLMNVNMGIQTNVSIPFVTYGGVYFIVNMMSIAIILSVYRRKDVEVI